MLAQLKFESPEGDSCLYYLTLLVPAIFSTQTLFPKPRPDFIRQFRAQPMRARYGAHVNLRSFRAHASLPLTFMKLDRPEQCI